MKKLLLVITILIALTLSGCTRTYKDEEEVVEAYLDLYADVLDGEEIDVVKSCDEIGDEIFANLCKATLYGLQGESLEYGPYENYKIDITDIESTKLSEEEKEEYGFEDYDDVYEVYVEWEETYTDEDGETTEETGDEFYVAEIDGDFYIIALG